MKDEPTKIQLIVRVTDGSFESSLSLPVASTPEEHNEFAKIWVGAMATAFNGSWVNAPAAQQTRFLRRFRTSNNSFSGSRDAKFAPRKVSR